PSTPAALPAARPPQLTTDMEDKTPGPHSHQAPWTSALRQSPAPRRSLRPHAAAVPSSPAQTDENRQTPRPDSPATRRHNNASLHRSLPTARSPAACPASFAPSPHKKSPPAPSTAPAPG